MDKDVWRVIRAVIRAADTSIPRVGRRPTFSDQLIVKMYFWTVAHDRPLFVELSQRHFVAKVFEAIRIEPQQGG